MIAWLVLLVLLLLWAGRAVDKYIPRRESVIDVGVGDVILNAA